MKLTTFVTTATSGIAIGAAVFAVPSFAQSTGAMDFEKSEIVVTGQNAKGVAGVQIPDTTKAKQVLTQELIARGTPGQTIDETINLVPGVVYNNNDGYGSSGGNLMIRGFDDTRISQTFDGMPTNDTGGYAIYGNQQLDPELIDQVNVNLGTTDVDSPTAAATGSTVNYRSIDPSEDFGARMVGTVGDYNKMRLFGLINTGNLNASGLRAWVSASKDTYDALYGSNGKINKTQFNAKVYQPLGNNGDFISLAAHYNFNRNNYTSDWLLSETSGIPLNKEERDDYTVASCSVPEGTSGKADSASSCGSAWESRYNPSRTANIRLNSRFTLSDKMVLTVDPSFQYVSANGGGTVTANEGSYSGVNGVTSGQIGGKYYFGGKDLNGDGDTLDSVRLSAPSQTVTNRLGLIVSLRYDIDENNRVRVAYSYDRGRHRQTGELGYLKENGEAENYFNNDDPLTDANGNVVQKRDRLSYAILHQFSGEYSGDFVDNKLHLAAGVRVPFFRRNLKQNCVTTDASGNVNCYTTEAETEAALAANSSYAAPQRRTFNWSRVLPTAGFTYDVAPSTQVFFNYSMGMQVPGTDNLYQTFYYAQGTEGAKAPKAETSNNFDAGVRYRTGIIQASLGAWYTIFQNRLSSAYNPETDKTTYTNLGTVDRYGIDATFAIQPDRHVKAYVFGSYLWSSIRDNVQYNSAGDTYATKGKMEGGVPHYTLGARLEGNTGPVSAGIEAKRTGSRYYNDQNEPMVSGTNNWGAKVPAYTVVNFDARLNLDFLGLDKTYVQANVTNLFDKFYYGSFDDAGPSTSSTVYTYLGAPRTFSASISMQF
ncbi:TonB-dependent receptor [Novosphingobium sp. Rr 2-17]|uniref:TonB-dependent receptor n=1 Tax=Novosphingobium sp. Rr 2-17 TaxID=555793 RepID=UPI0002697E46|nr:TonB-dependent receptor [Novosphingobium sp. Rr 2-17]EIZ80737.1 TonB-dependent receptor [Novosphingobium sp. Rr 2-17]